MGRNKSESEDNGSQDMASKNIDKDTPANSQVASDVFEGPVENNKNPSSKKDGEGGEDKASSRSGASGELQAAANSKAESCSGTAPGGAAVASKGDNQVAVAAKVEADVSESRDERLVMPAVVAAHVSPAAAVVQQGIVGRLQPEVVVKRGRGRPKKNPSPYFDLPKPKRARGRPRKNLLLAVAYGGDPTAAYKGRVGGLSLMGVVGEQPLGIVKNEVDYEENNNHHHHHHHHHHQQQHQNQHQEDDLSLSAVNGAAATREKGRSLPFRKSKRWSIPRINLEDFEDDSEDEPVRKKRSTRPKRFPPGGARAKVTTPSTSKKPRDTEQYLMAQVDRLASLVDRLENRINLDGLVDEDSDIETDLEDDVQVLLLQRNYNVKNELKRYFKDIVKAYVEELGAESGCLIASTRSYKNSGKFTVYEIWNAESDQMMFLKKTTNRIFSAETDHMLKTTSVVKTMNIPASWWQRCS